MATYEDLAGKVAFVTGGSRGLGAATCRALAANRAKVAVSGRDTDAIAGVVDELRSLGAEATAAVADCTDADALARAREHVEGEIGSVDVLLTFAGGGRQPQPVLEINDAEWREDIERNLTATFLTVKTFLAAMIDRGRGVIVTMASAAARLPGGAPVAYAAAKAGIVNFTQQVATEVAQHGIRVNCLAPSTVMNERMHAAIPREQQERMATMYPLGRLGEPRDVAEAALYLASDASSWVTGVTLDIAGGQVMR